MKHYPALIEADGDGFMVSFRDIPEALTGGDTHEEAVNMATDALVTAMDFYIEDKRTVPQPSKAEVGEVLIELPDSLVIKLMLLNEMVAQKLRPQDLANRLKVDRRNVTRLLDLNHATKIDSLSQAFTVLGKRLEVRVV